MHTYLEIKPGPTYAVTLPTSSAYSVVPLSGSSSPVTQGGSFSFTVAISDGYHKGDDFAVKANDSVLTADGNGIYTISNITQTQNITVEGVVKNDAKDGSSPQTNDPSTPIIFVILALVAACVAGTTIYRQKHS